MSGAKVLELAKDKGRGRGERRRVVEVEVLGGAGTPLLLAIQPQGTDCWGDGGGDGGTNTLEEGAQLQHSPEVLTPNIRSAI